MLLEGHPADPDAGLRYPPDDGARVGLAPLGQPGVAEELDGGVRQEGRVVLQDARLLVDATRNVGVAGLVGGRLHASQPLHDVHMRRRLGWVPAGPQVRHGGGFAGNAVWGLQPLVRGSGFATVVRAGQTPG